MRGPVPFTKTEIAERLHSRGMHRPVADAIADDIVKNRNEIIRHAFATGYRAGVRDGQDDTLFPGEASPLLLRDECNRFMGGIRE